MIRLEDLTPNASIRGIIPGQIATVVSAQWFGSEALELTYKDATGRVANELLYRHDEWRLDLVESGRPWSFDGNGALFRLVAEANRIRLAHLFDPVLAVHTSQVPGRWSSRTTASALIGLAKRKPCPNWQPRLRKARY